MEVFPYTEDDVCKVRKYFQVNDEIIKRDIAILKEWIRKQGHLPKNQSDEFLERLLLRNKFRIEQTKQKIDGYYSLRGLHKEYFLENNEDMVPSREVVFGMPLPKLTPNQERIYFMTLTNPDPEVYSIPRAVTYFNLILELVIRQDYSIGDKIIVDCTGGTFDHLKKVTPTDLSKALALYQGAYSARMIGIDIIHAPSIINILLNLLKLVFPAKLYSRITVHNDLESLHKSYPKECLPKDYGGDLESIEEMKPKMDVLYKENYAFFNENYNNVSDERLRIGDLQKDGGFGVEGTFKKLNLD